MRIGVAGWAGRCFRRMAAPDAGSWMISMLCQGSTHGDVGSHQEDHEAFFDVSAGNSARRIRWPIFADPGVPIHPDSPRPVLAKRTYRELKLLKHIRHENIISLSDIFISPLEDIYFVTELLGTDLHRLLTSRPLEKQFIQYFLYQILVSPAFDWLACEAQGVHVISLHSHREGLNMCIRPAWCTGIWCVVLPRSEPISCFS